MCGRMSLVNGNLDEVADELDALYTPSIGGVYRPRFNIAPTDRHIILRAGADETAGRFIELARWGFRAGPKLLINARAETAATRPIFRDAVAGRRCVIPADGFYEWGGPPDQRQPFWLHRPDGRLLLFAGIYADEGAGGEDDARRFCILTTNPNQVVAPIHDRMPVILDRGDVTAWLREGRPALLRPAPEAALEAVPVSDRVNSVKNDDAGCLAPAQAAADKPGQLRLF